MEGRANLVAVYITEAHAQNDWPISSARFTPDRQPVIVNQPCTSEQRIQLARDFVSKYAFRVPMLVDPIGNSFMEVCSHQHLRQHKLACVG